MEKTIYVVIASSGYGITRRQEMLCAYSERHLAEQHTAAGREEHVRLGGDEQEQIFNPDARPYSLMETYAVNAYAPGWHTRTDGDLSFWIEEIELREEFPKG